MIRIDKIKVKNFKSLSEAEIAFSPCSNITVLIGLNGAGKSTVLHLLDFIGELFRGDITSWLQKRSWGSNDLTTKLYSLSRKQLIELEVKGTVGDSLFEWQCSFNPITSIQRCTSESLSVDGENIYVKDNKIFLSNSEHNILFTYSGSIFSVLRQNTFTGNIANVINYLSSIRSFDMLAPRNIRNRSRISSSIGMSGENLAGFIENLSSTQRTEITSLLNKFYNFIDKFEIKTYRGGWKEISVWEDIGEHQDATGTKLSYILRRQAQHTNDGTLRLLAILASLQSTDNFLLFDEIENGFNPNVIQNIVKLLFESNKQVVITTHSPEILQYIPDDIAKRSIKLIFRTKTGSTAIANFFDNPTTEKKLNALSPGEVFLDVDIEKIVEYFENKTENNLD